MPTGPQGQKRPAEIARQPTKTVGGEAGGKEQGTATVSASSIEQTEAYRRIPEDLHRRASELSRMLMGPRPTVGQDDDHDGQV